MKFRIGVDVGGTFTDIVLINNSTLELVAAKKIPTTHSHCDGVAHGVKQLIDIIMTENNVSPNDIVFIAHGTTQATNALLEGDVAKVGIIGYGNSSWLENKKIKIDTNISGVKLPGGKYISFECRYAESFENVEEHLIDMKKSCDIVVAGAAYSVDNPQAELEVIKQIQAIGMLATGTHQISKLYGLRARTRTAAINASILPKMLQSANLMRDSIVKAGIKSPFMIMRGDGGNMGIEEVKERPLLTVLSGPAAGAAGALMHQQMYTGVFIEVGGTSTDISIVKNGKICLGYANIGGHRLYVNSLDVQTCGIGGGSLVKIKRDGTVVGVGPRSAHIAGLKYSAYADVKNMVDLTAEPMSLTDDDALYATVKSATGIYAITVTCAAAALGILPQDSYAYVDGVAARCAIKVFADLQKMSVYEYATKILDISISKPMEVVNMLVSAYELEPEQVVLSGGGGGSAAIVPYLAKKMDKQYKIVKNAEYISAIGVAKASIQEVVERLYQSDAQIDVVRAEAKLLAVNAGAKPETIAVDVKIENGIIRAIATGALEMRLQNNEQLGKERLLEIGKELLRTNNLRIIHENDEIVIINGIRAERKLYGLMKFKKYPFCVLDRNGSVKLYGYNENLYNIIANNIEQQLAEVIDRHTEYTSAGKMIPPIYMIVGKKLMDFSKLVTKEQILKMALSETKGLTDKQLIGIVCRR